MTVLTRWAVKEFPRILCFFFITPALVNTHVKTHSLPRGGGRHGKIEMIHRIKAKHENCIGTLGVLRIITCLMSDEQKQETGEH
jgi:hypothetical protein